MSASPNVLYVFEYYPVLSQTFLRREIAGLRAQGVRIEILSQHAPSAADRAQALVLRRDSSNDRPLTLILSPGGERKTAGRSAKSPSSLLEQRGQHRGVEQTSISSPPEGRGRVRGTSFHFF